MTKQDILVLQWNFSPPDYFEVPVIISRDDYQVTIQDGKVEATMEPGVYEGNPAIKDLIEDALNHRFCGVQLLSHEAYQLSYIGRVHLHPDGHKDFFKTLNDTVVFGAKIDMVVTGEDGNVIFDSREERIERKTELANLAEKCGSSDGLAKSLLASYHAAVRDPDNELVHLYEIREALAKEFGGAKRVCDELGISRSKWSKLGSLADNKPIKQGRHRGRFTAGLRDATENELEEARGIASTLILAYLRYLDKHSS